MNIIKITTTAIVLSLSCNQATNASFFEVQKNNDGSIISVTLAEKVNHPAILLGTVAAPLCIVLAKLAYDSFQRYKLNKKTSYQLLQDAQVAYENILNNVKSELDLIPYFELNQEPTDADTDKELSDKKNYVVMNALLAYQIKQRYNHSFPLIAYIKTIERDTETLHYWIKILADREKKLLYPTTSNVEITVDLRETLDLLNMQEYQLQDLLEQIQLLKSLIIHSNEYKTELLIKGKNSIPKFPPLYHHPIFNPGHDKLSNSPRPFLQAPSATIKHSLSTKNTLSTLLSNMSTPE